MLLVTKLLLSLSSIFLGSRSAEDRLGDNMCASGLLYLRNALYQKSITIWNLNVPGWCLNKDDQTLFIKKNKNRHNFGLEESTREKLMLVLNLLDAKEHENSQINCISRLLTALSILSTLFPTPIC